jgi:MFS superfamily sulfate permease-like transporter
MKRADIVAGLSVAGLMLPEAVAYAAIAGLPAARALVAAVVGATVYALAGRSRFAIVSPTSSSAAILAAALATTSRDPVLQAMLATLATGLVGLSFLLAGTLRLGGLTSLVSRPVLRGFAFGLAITIIIKQLPVLAGVEAGSGGSWDVLVALLSAIDRWNGVSVAVGLVSLALLLGLRRYPLVPGALVVLMLGIIASVAMDLPGRGLAVVGPIHLAWAWPGWSGLDLRVVNQLADLVLPLLLILLAESWGTMRTLALRHGDTVNADRELRALGWSNLAVALAQGMPVGAGFSAGSANEAAGARSRFAGIVAAAGLAALMLIAGGAVAQLPKTVLAAVVIAALAHALDPAPLFRLWKLGRDLPVALGAAAAVLLLGVLNGMLVAILLSLALLIRRLSSPQLVRLGRIGEHDYVDVARHPEAWTPASAMIWRPAEPLFFGNAERILAAVELRQQAEPQAKLVVLSLEESFDLDSTALDALVEFDSRLLARGLSLRLARVRDTIRDLLDAAGADDLAKRCSYSVDDAVGAMDWKDPTL